MNIVHLSDTHVGMGDNEQRLARIIDRILTEVDPRDSLVVHTGDLIDRSTPAQSQRGLALLERLRAAGLRTLLVPGNHDYGDAVRVDKDRAERFRQCFASFIFGDAAPVFPVETRIGDCHFIGLDTSEEELGWLTGLFAEGCVGETQRGRLDAILTRLAAESPRPTVVVYLHHHPFIDGYVVAPDVGDSRFIGRYLTWATRRFRRLKDACSVLDILRDRVDILLFGHQHYGLDHRAEAERYGLGMALDASSSTGTAMFGQRMRFRIIDTQTRRARVVFVD